MLFSIIDPKNSESRLNEMIKQAEEYNQAKKYNQGRTFRLPKLSNLFAGRKSEYGTLADTQAR